jgi:hypothetical protein
MTTLPPDEPPIKIDPKAHWLSLKPKELVSEKEVDYLWNTLTKEIGK